MNIINVNTTGVTDVSPALKLKYTITSVAGKPDRVSATIVRNEACVGYLNADREGVFGFSLPEKNNLTPPEVRQLFEAAISDIQTLFGSNEQA